MRNIILFIVSIQFYYSQDKGLTSFEKKDYKQSYEYYLKVLRTRKNDISAKFGAGISAFKNKDIENGMKYLKEVSSSENDTLASRANFNLANIYKDENKLEESLYHYKKSIELNSKDKDAKINYELLKKMLEQEDQENKNSQSDEGGEKGEHKESESNQSDEGSEKQEDHESDGDQGDSGDQKQEDLESEGNQGDSGDQKQEDQESHSDKNSEANIGGDDNKKLSDKEIQAEAILNALKDQEKINQKQKLLKFKAKTVEKDW